MTDVSRKSYVSHSVRVHTIMPTKEHTIFGPTHGILVLIAYAQKPLLNAYADVSSRVRAFIYIHTLCMREAKALASLRIFISADSPRLSLFADRISTVISCTGTYGDYFSVYLD